MGTLSLLMQVPGWAIDRLRYAYNRYPARTLAVMAYAVVFICAKAGLVVEQQSVLASLSYGVPILLGGQVVHNKVEPVKGVRKPKKLANR